MAFRTFGQIAAQALQASWVAKKARHRNESGVYKPAHAAPEVGRDLKGIEAGEMTINRDNQASVLATQRDPRATVVAFDGPGLIPATGLNTKPARLDAGCVPTPNARVSINAAVETLNKGALGSGGPGDGNTTEGGVGQGASARVENSCPRQSAGEGYPTEGGTRAVHACSAGELSAARLFARYNAERAKR